ncbi:MAG: hypothetical protein M1823_005169 [Watsoniomyces obsoletus]|nr:MAG: hypothetical protein M1823_005169 [Watsoniomyces obsoletus]
MNPYEARPDRIPLTDRYQDVPLYGRYHPQEDDFHPHPTYIQSTTPDGQRYWESVLERCNPHNRIYENEDGGRDVFALGSVIIKSSHLKEELEGRRASRDYSLADRNEVEATTLVRQHLKDVSIQIPQIYFAGKIHGRAVLVQSRVPGVGLNVAWQYISPAQKASFKAQARDFLQRVRSCRSPILSPSYVVPDDDPVAHRGIQTKERDIIFGGPIKTHNDNDLGLMHNDLTPSNIIVDRDRIVGVVDWEMAGFFGWEIAKKVHAEIRSPKEESYAHLHLPQDFLDDLFYWNDLYEIDVAQEEVG